MLVSLLTLPEAMLLRTFCRHMWDHIHVQMAFAGQAMVEVLACSSAASACLAIALHSCNHLRLLSQLLLCHLPCEERPIIVPSLRRKTSTAHANLHALHILSYTSELDAVPVSIQTCPAHRIFNSLFGDTMQVSESIVEVTPV